MFRLDENNVKLVEGQVYLLRITQWIKYKNDSEFLLPMYFLGFKDDYPVFNSAAQVAGYDNDNPNVLFKPFIIDRDFLEAASFFGTVKVETALTRKPTTAIRGQ